MCGSEQSKYKNVLDDIEKNIVNDYFTPNIKAEVIFDMLMTDTVADIVGHYVKEDVHFITKEMSLAISDENLEGKKVDYVLASKECIYLIELKTTTGSYNEDQKKFYSKYLKNDFSLMLTTLLDIADSKFGNKTIRESIKQGANLIENLRLFFEARIDTYKNQRTGIKLEKNLANNADRAKAYLKKYKCESSWEYLYTMGQILDYFDKNQDNGNNWEQFSLKLVYITPRGEEFENNNEIKDAKKIEDINQISITFQNIVNDNLDLKEKQPIFEFLCKIINECMDFRD